MSVEVTDIYTVGIHQKHTADAGTAQGFCGKSPDTAKTEYCDAGAAEFLQIFISNHAFHSGKPFGQLNHFLYKNKTEKTVL